MVISVKYNILIFLFGSVVEEFLEKPYQGRLLSYVKLTSLCPFPGNNALNGKVN